MRGVNAALLGAPASIFIQFIVGLMSVLQEFIQGHKVT